MQQAFSHALKAQERLHGFVILSSEPLAEYKGVGIHARHEVTGLEVFHLLTDDEENLFSYSFMTAPEDSTGVAHILEHSVLCGSRRYPLKDPFLVLAKQSVKTFLNAMTFPDKTVYPASSMVEADYFNLMRVYGDAVFFPLLDEWIFRQEGHRFEKASDGSVSIQGVVFNEMKGNYSSFDTIAADWSLKSILGSTIYAHDSGGDPADIPALTWKQFRDFHRTYYHPVNCKVFLSGNIPTERQLALLQEEFLCHFTSAPAPALVSPSSDTDWPKEFVVPAPSGDGQDLSLVTAQLNWLLPAVTDVVTYMEANLLTEILLGHDGSPLNRVLLESALGEDVAPSSGIETEVLHLCFSVGLRGMEKDDVPAFEQLVLDTLGDIAAHGVSSEELESAVRSIDFSNREVRRSGGPFSLTLMRRSLRGWIHGVGPYETLRVIPAFEEVKTRLANKSDYIQSLVRRFLLDNPRRARVVIYPDSQWIARMDERVDARVKLFESTLSGEEEQAFLSRQEDLFARQREADSEEQLALIPHLSRSDLPPVADSIPSRITTCGKVPIVLHEQPVNKIIYVDLAVPIDVIKTSDYPLLPFFSAVLTSMAVDGLSWVEASLLTARYTASLGAMLFSSQMVSGYQVPQSLEFVKGGRDFLMIRMKALEELSSEAISLMFRFFEKADFSDTKRLLDLLNEYRNDLESSLAPAGNQYAVSRAAAFASRTKAVDEIWNGLTQLRFIRELCAQAKDTKALVSLAERLTSIAQQLRSSGIVVNATAEATSMASLQAQLSPHLEGYDGPAPYTPDQERASELYCCIEPEFSGSFRLLISSPLQVGFAAAVLPSVPYTHPDHPVEIVLGHWLSSGPLWERIRTTGGAYGAFSYPDSLEDLFVMATYRDPQPLASLAVFKEALEEASLHPIESKALDRIVTGAYSREIQPRSPSDKGFTAFIRLLYGITDEARKTKIAGILAVTPAELSACATRLLDSWPSVCQAVFAGEKMLKDGENDRFAGKVAKMTI